MFLIDSSLWIEYLRPKGSKTIKARVREALQREEALTCGIVIVELLRGARVEKDYLDLQDSMFSLPMVLMDEPVFERAARWGFELDRKGKLVSTTDLLIASAAHQQVTVLHNDSDFELIASELPLDQERII